MESYNSKDLAVYQEKTNTIMTKANSFNIKTEDDVYNASNYLKEVNDTLKAIEAKRLQYTKPLNDSLRAINNDFKRISAPLSDAVNLLKRKITTWQLAERQRIQKEEERRRKIQEAHAKQGHEVNAPVEMHRPLKTIGNAQLRKVWKYELADFSKVPDEYKQLNPGAITAAIRAGKREIPGLTIKEDYTTAALS